jgi:POT family proton-dependent oligopeptide transporter
MRKLGFIDAACMNNADAVSVLFFGYVIGQKLYPFLADKGIKIPTTYKFAIGSFLGSLAIGWSLLMEYMIHRQYNENGEKISIMWQAMSYILVGVGEIFAVSAAYEVAFQASLPEQKALASAVNLFCVGGLPNVFCIGLYHACKPWFQTSTGTASINHLKAYSEAHVWKYFFVLFLISLFGVFLNLLPPVRRFVENVEDAAVEVIKTPKTPSRPPRHKRMDSWDFSDAKKEEMSPLIRAKRHQAYLKYGSGPVLTRNSSMRAGPSLSKKGKKAKNLKRSSIAKLYNSEPVMPKMNVLMDPSGRPVQAGSLHRDKETDLTQSADLPRSASSDALV